jgi:hypothetical protein
MVLLAVILMPISSMADSGAPPPDIKVPLPSGGGGTTVPAKQTNSSCPKFVKSVIYTVIGAGSADTPRYGFFEYSCNGETPTQVWGCVANCPPGVVQLVSPPDPGFVADELIKRAPLPIPNFAPPAERDDVAAITGLRLYVHISDETYRYVVAEYKATGPWWAIGVETPGKITLDLDGVSVECATNPPDPTTAAGRDGNECFVPVTTVPEGGLAKVTVTVQWHVVIDTNVPGVDKERDVDKTSELTIRVKELQAVVEG